MLGPGDEHLVKMRVFNSYKQIKFYGTGTGTGARQLNPILESSLSPSTIYKVLAPGSVNDELTKRDSIFPSELDAEDQQTQTIFDPVQIGENFLGKQEKSVGFNSSNKNKNKTQISPKQFEFGEDVN